jgi:hypothetical protein
MSQILNMVAWRGQKVQKMAPLAAKYFGCDLGPIVGIYCGSELWARTFQKGYLAAPLF